MVVVVVVVVVGCGCGRHQHQRSCQCTTPPLITKARCKAQTCKNGNGKNGNIMVHVTSTKNEVVVITMRCV